MPIRVRDVMKNKVRSVPPGMKLSELEEVLLREGISGVPVIESGEVLGVVSRSDIVKHLQVEQDRAAAMAAFYLEPFDADQISDRDRERVSEAIAARLQNATVADAMTRSLIQVAPGDSLQAAARTMLERRVHRILVMEGSVLVGIVSSSDLIRLFAEDRVAVLG